MHEGEKVVGESFNIQKYMTQGVENIVSNAIHVTLSNPAESIFMAKFAMASKAASKKRAEKEEQGEHIPAFLTSFTSVRNPTRNREMDLDYLS